MILDNVTTYQVTTGLLILERDFVLYGYCTFNSIIISFYCFIIVCLYV